MRLTVGEILRKERESKGLSLDQVFHLIHVKVLYLQAIENNQLEYLPSDVQGKGFLRLYAGLLGLPVQPLLDAWATGGFMPDPNLQPAVEPIQTEPHLPAEDVNSQPDVVDQEENNLQTRDLQFDSEPLELEDLPAPDEPQPSDIFKEIGFQLRTQRERLGLKLADIERFIMVRQHYLIALEEGRFDDLPSSVQGRGMLNNYASFLEMDVDRILLLFAEALQKRQRDRQSADLSRKPIRPLQNNTTGSRTRKTLLNRDASSWRQFLTPDLIIGSVVILTLFVFAIWSAAQISSIRSAQVEPTAPELANVLINDTPDAPTQEPTPTPTENRLPLGETEVGAPLVNNEITGQETAVGTESPDTGSSAPLQLYIVARQRAWVQISADNKVIFSGRVAPGNAYPFNAQNRLELRTGNGAALQVFFNQNDLGTLGLVGQVVALVFSAEGVQTPTPSASLTPTPTARPSATLQPTPTLATPTVTPFIP